jgi:hypothetical protein
MAWGDSRLVPMWKGIAGYRSIPVAMDGLIGRLVKVFLDGNEPNRWHTTHPRSMAARCRSVQPNRARIASHAGYSGERGGGDQRSSDPRADRATMPRSTPRAVP